MVYKSQKIANWYFTIALFLFVLQVIMGLWLISNYVFTIPQEIVNVFPFATARAMHTNLLVLWMLLAFMGGDLFHRPHGNRERDLVTKSRLVSVDRPGCNRSCCADRLCFWLDQGQATPGDSATP